jgi:hypothetical protein
MFGEHGFGCPPDTPGSTSIPFKKIVGYYPPRNEMAIDVIISKLTELGRVSQTKTALLKNPQGRVMN